MTIETKFKEGDTIFFLKESKVLQNIVRGIKIERRKKEKGYVNEIVYLCNSDEAETLVHIKVPEEIAFKSKQDLISSL